MWPVCGKYTAVDDVPAGNARVTVGADEMGKLVFH